MLLGGFFLLKEMLNPKIKKKASVVILRYTVTPLGGWTYIYLEDLGDNEYTRGGSRVRTINNPFEFTESWQQDSRAGQMLISPIDSDDFACIPIFVEFRAVTGNPPTQSHKSVMNQGHIQGKREENRSSKKRRGTGEKKN